MQSQNFKLYDSTVSSINKHLNIKNGPKNEFHGRIFCKTLIRQHSCTTHFVQTVPVLAAILQKKPMKFYHFGPFVIFRCLLIPEDSADYNLRFLKLKVCMFYGIGF